MHISEDDAGINNSASIISTSSVTNFNFGDQTPNTAQYTFTFNVVQNCFVPSNQAEITDSANEDSTNFILDLISPGKVSWFSKDIDT